MNERESGCVATQSVVSYYLTEILQFGRGKGDSEREPSYGSVPWHHIGDRCDRGWDCHSHCL